MLIIETVNYRIESAEKLGKSSGLDTCLTFNNTTKVSYDTVVGENNYGAIHIIKLYFFAYFLRI